MNEKEIQEAVKIARHFIKYGAMQSEGDLTRVCKALIAVDGDDVGEDVDDELDYTLAAIDAGETPVTRVHAPDSFDVVFTEALSNMLTRHSLNDKTVQVVEIESVLYDERKAQLETAAAARADAWPPWQGVRPLPRDPKPGLLKRAMYRLGSWIGAR